MDLTILFSPIDESIYQKTYAPNSIFKSIRVFGDKMPDYKGAHIAIFGVKEERGTKTNTGSAKGPDEIRKKLYNLKKGTGAYRIVDLGNLNAGIDLDETYVRISEVCRILLENNVLAVDLRRHTRSGLRPVPRLRRNGKANQSAQHRCLS
jgi:formiminoglutamase